MRRILGSQGFETADRRVFVKCNQVDWRFESSPGHLYGLVAKLVNALALKASTDVIQKPETRRSAGSKKMA
jgi:hypothetical protein